MNIPDLYRRHLDDPRRERGFLSALGFTAAFGTARAITHMIKNGIGPFGNVSAGGTHIHHSTFGILGLLGVGYVWTYQLGIGRPAEHRWPSRVSAAAYGVASALTLDEFALWLDLKDEYWSKQGRKSIDAVAIFAGLLSMGVAGRSALNEAGMLPKALERFL
jgi:hypothetical protein